MIAIAQLFWRICVFKAGPDAVPPNQYLVVAAICVDGLVSLLAQVFLNDFSWLNAATAVVVNIAMITALIYGLLSMMELTARFQQTIGAIFGTDIILTLITIVALLLTSTAPELLASIVSIASLFWTLAVFGFIYHHAMNIHIGFGIAFAFFSIVFSYAVAFSLIA